MSRPPAALSPQERRRGRGRRAALVLTALALLGIGAWSLAREALAPAPWVRVERRDLVLGVPVEGELEAVDSATLGPPQLAAVWDFKISFLAPEGAEVAAGAPVLRFDTTRLEQQLLEVTAERDSAEKELEKQANELAIQRRDQELQLSEAEAELRRAELKLAVPADLVRRNELLTAQIDRRLAERRIEYLRASLDHLAEQTEAELAALHGKRDRAAGRVTELEQLIARLTVRAPRAGTVIYVSSWRGEKKKVGDSVWRGDKVLEIPDLSRMRATGEVAEADVGRIAVGQRVALRLDAYPDREYAGTLRRIEGAVQRKSRRNPEKVVAVEIALDATDSERMRPGMRLRGTIEAERVSGVLAVPSEAIFVEPEGSAVYVATLFGRQRVFPTFGKRNAGWFEVVDGLAEGDRVLRRGAVEGAP